MIKRVNIPIKAFRPLARGKRGIPIRGVLTGNCQQLLTEWINHKQSVGDYLIFEVSKD